jgi:hypothetical protein
VRCNGQVIRQQIYKVCIPKNSEPALELDSVLREYKTGGLISKSEFVNSTGIKFIIKDLGYIHDFYVVSFDVSVQKDGMFETISSEGMSLNEKQKDLIMGLDKNAKVFIEEIRIQMSEGVRKLPTMKFRIE